MILYERLIVLVLAITDGLLKFIVFETVAMLWVTRLCTTCYHLVLGQDKWWFDGARTQL